VARSFWILGAVCILAGCNGAEKDYGGTVQAGKEPAKLSAEEQIKAIEANPHMPEKAKQAAIAHIQSAPGGRAKPGKP